jgi:hypothetical protein
MDQLNHCQTIIRKILTEYHKIFLQVSDPDIDEVLIFDDERGHYIWLNIGWKDGEKVNAMSVYVRLKNNKIYIEEDWTEEGIANELIREGIAKEEIVLAFYSPEHRKFTDCAIA